MYRKEAQPNNNPRLLKRRQIRNSRSCAVATAHLLSLIVSKYHVTDVASIIKRVQEVGQILTTAQPKELAVGNIVRRVLGVIREEAEENREAEGNLFIGAGTDDPREARDGRGPPIQQHNRSSRHPHISSQEQDAICPKTLFEPYNELQDLTGNASGQPRSLGLTQVISARGNNNSWPKSMFNLLSHPSPSTHSAFIDLGVHPPTGLPSNPVDISVKSDVAIDLRAEIVEAIAEIIEELNTADDQIAGYALDHVHSDEIILTNSCSLTIQKFLLKAASKRKFTVIYVESFPNDHNEVYATIIGYRRKGAHMNHTEGFHKSLAAAGVNVILVPDAAVFALMSRVNEVILGTHAVLADGSLVAAAGSRSIAKAANMHKTPVIILAAVFKLCPTYLFGMDTYMHFGGTSIIFSKEDADLINDVEVDNPLYDHIPFGLIDLYVTNL